MISIKLNNIKKENQKNAFVNKLKKKITKFHAFSFPENYL
jgi:hypothetical protein